jgi:hypothetical protein
MRAAPPRSTWPRSGDSRALRSDRDAFSAAPCSSPHRPSGRLVRHVDVFSCSAGCDRRRDHLMEGHEAVRPNNRRLGLVDWATTSRAESSGYASARDARRRRAFPPCGFAMLA